MEEAACPFLELGWVCAGALSLHAPGAGLRGELCTSEDYDRCPIYLACLLTAASRR